MAEERRSAPRARISGARITYESANGDPTETDTLNLARGGLFIRTERPLAVGKRLALEIQVAGELVPWSALGRVVWIREHDEGDRRPAGMGVKLIDVEDAVVATIERLVAGRAHVDAGIDSPPQPALVAPIVSVGGGRERTILGVGGSGFPAPERPFPREGAGPQSMTPEPAEAREPSVVVDLVSRSTPTGPAQAIGRRSKETLRPTAPYVQEAASSTAPRPVERAGGRGWIFVLVLLVAAGAAAYLLLDGGIDRLRTSEPSTAPPPPPLAAAAAPALSSTRTASASESAAPATPATATAATASASENANATASATTAATSTATAVPYAPGGLRRPFAVPAPRAAGPKRSVDEGNPY